MKRIKKIKHTLKYLYEADRKKIHKNREEFWKGGGNFSEYIPLGQCVEKHNAAYVKKNT